MSHDFPCHAANRRRRRRRRMRAIALQGVSQDFSVYLANIFASVPLSIRAAEAGDAKRKQFVTVGMLSDAFALVASVYTNE